MTVVWIGVAGAAGALTRYGVGRAVGTRSFPWATLGINLVGSLALGILLKSAMERGWSDTTVQALGIGYLGAFTTFSTFSADTHTMLRDGRTGAALTYVLASVVGGVIAAAIGYAIAKI